MSRIVREPFGWFIDGLGGYWNVARTWDYTSSIKCMGLSL